MSYLAPTLKVAAVFQMVMGTLNCVVLPRMISNTSKSDYQPHNPAAVLADSHLRYWAGIWASTGVLLWWTSEDIAARKFPLLVMGAGSILGGVGRLISGIKLGFQPEGLVKTITVVEILAPVAAWMFMP